MPKKPFRTRVTNWKQERRKRERAGARRSTPDGLQAERDAVSEFDLPQAVHSSGQPGKLWAAGAAHQHALESLHQLLGHGYRQDAADALKNVLATAGTDACIRFADVLADLVLHHDQTSQQLASSVQDAKNEQQRLWAELEVSVAAEEHLRSLVNDMSAKLAELQRLADALLDENEDLRQQNEWLLHECEQLLEASTTGAAELREQKGVVRVLKQRVNRLEAQLDRRRNATASYARQPTRLEGPMATNVKTRLRRRQLAEHLITILAGDAEGALLTMIDMMTANQLLQERTVVAFIEDDVNEWRSEQNASFENRERTEGRRASVVGLSRNTLLEALQVAPESEVLGTVSQLHVQAWQPPSKTALSRYLCELETPPRFDVRRLIERASEAAAVSAEAAAAVRVEISDTINPYLRNIYGRLMSLPELLTQHLQFLGLRAESAVESAQPLQSSSRDAVLSAASPSDIQPIRPESTPMDVDEKPGASIDDHSSNAKNSSEPEQSDDQTQSKWPAYWLRLDDTLHLIIAGDGVQLTRHNKRQWTIIRFGLANLAVAQQSPLMWPLLAAIQCKETDPVVGLVLRFYNQQLRELKQTGLSINGQRVNFHSIPTGDLKFLAHAFKGQLGQSATHFDVTFSRQISRHNKNQLRPELLTREESNSYEKRMADLQRFMDSRRAEAQRLRRELLSSDEAKIAAALHTAQTRVPLDNCDDDIYEGLHSALRLAEQLLRDVVREALLRDIKRQKLAATSSDSVPMATPTPSQDAVGSSSSSQSGVQAVAEELRKLNSNLFERVAPKIEADAAHTEFGFIGAQARLVLVESWRVVDALQYAGESEAEQGIRAIFAERAFLLRKLAPAWRSKKVKTGRDLAEFKLDSHALYNLMRTFFMAAHISPMLVHASVAAPIKAAIASELGITLADTLTEALESGGAQFKKRFHRSSNKQQLLAADTTNSCVDQIIKMEQLHRQVKSVELLTEEWRRSQSSAAEHDNTIQTTCACGRSKFSADADCSSCRSPERVRVRKIVELVAQGVNTADMRDIIEAWHKTQQEQGQDSVLDDVSLEGADRPADAVDDMDNGDDDAARPTLRNTGTPRSAAGSTSASGKRKAVEGPAESQLKPQKRQKGAGKSFSQVTTSRTPSKLRGAGSRRKGQPTKSRKLDDA